MISAGDGRRCILPVIRRTNSVKSAAENRNSAFGIGASSDGPSKGCPMRFDRHGETSLANGRQPSEWPVLHTVLLQGLAFAVAKLTPSHPQTVLVVPMECLGACSTTSITSYDSSDFPPIAVRHKNFASPRISAIVLQNHDLHLWSTPPSLTGVLFSTSRTLCFAKIAKRRSPRRVDEFRLLCLTRLRRHPNRIVRRSHWHARKADPATRFGKLLSCA